MKSKAVLRGSLSLSKFVFESVGSSSCLRPGRLHPVVVPAAKITVRSPVVTRRIILAVPPAKPPVEPYLRSPRSLVGSWSTSTNEASPTRWKLAGLGPRRGITWRLRSVFRGRPDLTPVSESMVPGCSRSSTLTCCETDLGWTKAAPYQCEAIQFHHLALAGSTTSVPRPGRPVPRVPR